MEAKFTVVGVDLRSAVWTLKTHKGNAYLWPKPLGGDFKISLHGDCWRYGFTTDHLDRPGSLIDPDDDRAVFKWQRPAAGDNGITTCLFILIPPPAVDIPVVGDELRTVTTIPLRAPAWVELQVVIGPVLVAMNPGGRGMPQVIATAPLGETERISIVGRYGPERQLPAPQNPVARGDLEQLRTVEHPRVLAFFDTEGGTPLTVESIVQVSSGSGR